MVPGKYMGFEIKQTSVIWNAPFGIFLAPLDGLFCKPKNRINTLNYRSFFISKTILTFSFILSTTKTYSASPATVSTSVMAASTVSSSVVIATPTTPASATAT